ncbi:MAG: galactoside ABC transporter permease [Treponema sp.]|uniref:ABC transporter permease subunit n=1 Tax=Treponema sp. TaxID=166 RepID=UPI0025E3B999|nr:galactoside ABC transporter permease [Treponema sp.]MBQ9280822.1 galactoside ABC transporter permease [Treponema sp.]
MEDKELNEYSERLTELRKDGVNLISALKQENAAAKRNRLLSAEEREKLVVSNNEKINAAKIVADKNKAEIAEIVKKAVARNNEISKTEIARVNAEQNEVISKLKAEYEESVSKIESATLARKKEIIASYAGKTSQKDVADCKEDLRVAEYEHKSALFDAKNKFNSNVDAAKAVKNQAYVDYVQKNRALRNGQTNFKEDCTLAIQNYINKFKMSKFLLDNGLYLAIIVFFIVCIILAPLSGNGNLLSLPNIFTILEQSSVRMFYALGVAGLILLAGTDLSVGRMVALGAVITGLILHPGQNIVTFFGLGPWDFTALPTFARLGMALGLSIILCVVFSAFAGVFSAKLKIHPFISTLATQLIIYGLLFFGTSGTPVGSIDADIKDMLGGRWIIGMLNGELITFPKLIIPAIIAIIVAWFIWNKTTFGKNMYAVGGNAEAASVSGISVFWVTMGVFIMAGIFYGCGAFLETFKANASAGTGQGYELDAIAACVVGGISFNGGIGKIGGAVIGVIIFTSLTYCLTFLGIDTNLQFVFKGLIIIAAVALDSVKYLKRK